MIFFSMKERGLREVFRIRQERSSHREAKTSQHTHRFMRTVACLSFSGN